MFQTTFAAKIIKHILFTAYEIMWKNMLQPDRPQKAIRYIRNACWITKATDTHSEYIKIINFPDNSSYANVPQCYVIQGESLRRGPKLLSIYSDTSANEDNSFRNHIR